MSSDDELLAAMWRAFQAAEHVGHPDGPMAAILAVVRAHDRDSTAAWAETLTKANQSIEAIAEQRDAAVRMLADWCVAIKRNGTGWDDWDEHYKDAAYREGPLRALLDAAIDVARARGE